MEPRTLLLPPIAAATFLVLLIWTGSAVGATEKVLYSFNTYAQGAEPVANLIADAGGNLYGTTRLGGAHELGVVFKLTPSQGHWTETVLYSFKGGSDGQGPTARLLFDSASSSTAKAICSAPPKTAAPTAPAPPSNSPRREGRS